MRLQLWNANRDLPGEIENWLQEEVQAAVISYVTDGDIGLFSPDSDASGTEATWHVKFFAAEPMEGVECLLPLSDLLKEEIGSYAKYPQHRDQALALREVLQAAIDEIDRLCPP